MVLGGTVLHMKVVTNVDVVNVYVTVRYLILWHVARQRFNKVEFNRSLARASMFPTAVATVRSGIV